MATNLIFKNYSLNFLYSTFFLCYYMSFLKSDVQARINIPLTNVNNENKYEYCKDDGRLTSYEFQMNLNVMMFRSPDLNEVVSIHQTIQNVIDGSEGKRIAMELIQDFISFSKYITLETLEPRQEIFLEDAYYLTKEDGSPLDGNNELELPFDGTAYVRKRIGSDVKEEESLTLMSVVDPDYIEATVKLNDIAEKFIIPNQTSDWKIECDIYSSENRISYSEDVKDGIKDSASLNVFGLVTDIYPWTNSMFKYDKNQNLPLEGYFYDHRYYWKNVYLMGIKCKCSLDLRFRDDILIALTAMSPYEAEFQCRIKKEDVINTDIIIILNEMRRIFQEFDKNSNWTLKEKS